jgi:hypothetical protein
VVMYSGDVVLGSALLVAPGETLAERGAAAGAEEAAAAVGPAAVAAGS